MAVSAQAVPGVSCILFRSLTAPWSAWPYREDKYWRVALNVKRNLDLNRAACLLPPNVMFAKHFSWREMPGCASQVPAHQRSPATKQYFYHIHACFYHLT